MTKTLLYGANGGDGKANALAALRAKAAQHFIGVAFGQKSQSVSCGVFAASRSALALRSKLSGR